MQRRAWATQRRHNVAWPPWLAWAELDANESVRTLGKALIQYHALPAKAEMDAYHVAIAAVHGMEFLLTWNCTNIANAATRPKIEATCRRLGFEPPIICTPLELMEE